jgi:hypothetical protein
LRHKNRKQSQNDIVYDLTNEYQKVRKTEIVRCKPQTVKMRVWGLRRPTRLDCGADRLLGQVALTENSCEVSFKMAAVGHLFEVKNTAVPRLPEVYTKRCLLKTGLRLYYSLELRFLILIFC